MTYRQLLKALRPDNGDTFNLESFEHYYVRIGHLLPIWPECSMREWLHRHYSDAVNDYSWLRFDTLSFERVTWATDFIYQNVQTYKMKMLENQGQQILTGRPRMRTHLQKMMLATGTWPAPIIVLENSSGMAGPNGETLGAPYHLVEGHLRTDYFRNLYREMPEALKGQHDIWLVRMGAKV